MMYNLILDEIRDLRSQESRSMRLRTVLVAIGALLIALCGTRQATAQCGPGSVGFASVGQVPGSPFEAETVTRLTLGEGDSAKTVERPGNVSRDQEGRIRSERVVSKYKITTGDDMGKEVEVKMILICDPVAQTLTQLDTLNKTAKVVRYSKDTATNTPNQRRNYCEALSVFSDLDLGHSMIEGLEAEGKRRIDERKRGVDASGREIPDKTVDQWCAPELQAVVLQVSVDVGREVTELKNIRRVEPAPSLFDIPADYTILEKTPWPSPSPTTPATNR